MEKDQEEEEEEEQEVARLTVVVETDETYGGRAADSEVVFETPVNPLHHGRGGVEMGAMGGSKPEAGQHGSGGAEEEGGAGGGL